MDWVIWTYETHNFRKDKTMNNSEIQRLQRWLQIHREAALTSLDRLADETRTVDSNYPQDVADRCVTSLSKESLFQQANERRRVVRMIEAALARIQRGAFGVCIECGDEIDLRRLEAVPWTPYCLRCQLGREHGKQFKEKEYRDENHQSKLGRYRRTPGAKHTFLNDKV
jgi:DnaK suppressor protein